MKRLSSMLLIATLTTSSTALACTDFRIKAKDNTVLITRSMEFAQDMHSNLRSSPVGRNFNNQTPNKKPGHTWKSKYGYLYIDGMGMDAALDGMNDKGLSFEYLYLPGETQYQAVPAGQDNHALPYTQLGDWVLGNFKNVEEVRQALTDIYVFTQEIPGMGNRVFPVHAAIYDASSKGIVVEFVNGKMNIYDNKVGILTNSPTYDWQVTNLRNYVNLSPYTPNPVIAGSMSFAATGQGGGSVGLPGDTTPPSRFVKTAFLLKTATPATDPIAALNLAQHIINNVDIPLGAVRAKQGNKDINELTQWVVFKDLTNKMFYYRTYNDMTLHVVPLEKINLTEKALPLKMPLKNKPVVVDVAEQFAKSKAN